MLSQDAFFEQLRRRLAGPLPGAAAQRRMEPELSYGRHTHVPPATARQAAVALVMYPAEAAGTGETQRQNWLLPLVVRPATMTDHAGQIGLPGGCVEPGESSEQAALRELQEELGIDPAQVELLGPLSSVYLFVTNFAITPWLGVCRGVPRFIPNAGEVEQVLHVPLAWLSQRANVSTYRHCTRGIEFTAPCYAWEGHPIWGATAIMLSEFAELVGGVSWQ